MEKAPLLVLVILAMTVSSAGCIDIEWTRDNFLQSPQPTIAYIESYTNITHVFDTDPDNLDTLAFNQIASVEVAEGSLHIDVRIKTQFDELPEDFPVNLTDLQERLDIERELVVTLLKPNNETFQTGIYPGTSHQWIQWDKISSPEMGSWYIKVEAEGLGNDLVGYNDNIQVQVIVSTPTMV